jgi:hypothetical protein
VLKRTRPTASDVEPQPQPIPPLALPEAVWQDHVVPLLHRCEDAARLGATCRALRKLVRDHVKDLGNVELKKIQAALTTFPQARSLAPYHDCVRGLSPRGRRWWGGCARKGGERASRG